VFWAATTCLGDFSEQFEQAEQLRQQKRFGEAEMVYRQIIASAGVSDDGLKAYKELILLRPQDRLSQARDAYKQLMASFEGYEGLVGLLAGELGCMFREAGDYRTAEEIYQYLLSHSTGSGQELSYRSSLFKCYVGLGDDPNAEDQLQQVLTRFAEDEALANTVWDMAYECRSMKKWGRSRALFQHFMQHWGGHEKALLAQRGIAKASIKLGDVERADAAIARLIEIFGTSKGVIHQVKELANDWAESDRYDKAIPVYAEVVSRWATDANAMLAQKQIGMAQLALEDFDKADAAVDKLVSDFAGWADVPEAVYEIAKKNSELGRHDKAAEQFRLVLERWRGHEDAIWCQMELVMGKIRQWDLDGAEGELGSLLSGFAEDRRLAEAVHEIVEEYRNTGAHEAGRELFNYLLTEWAAGDETMLELQVGIALQSIKLNELVKAESAVERLIADYNDNPKIGKALFQIAEQYYYGNRFQQCIDVLELIRKDYAHRHFAAESELPFVLATCYRTIGEYDKAIEYYEASIAEYPEGKFGPRSPYWLGLLHLKKKKDYEQAVYWLDQVRQLYPQSSLVKRSMYFRAVAYFRNLRDYGKAAEAFEEYIAQYPHSSEVWACYMDLAECHAKLGDSEQAIAILQTAYDRAASEAVRRELAGRIKALEKGGEQ
jgi:tetratricopeptide (TPR) repeat protein